MSQLSTFARRCARWALRVGALFVVFVALVASAWPQKSSDLTSASIEDLMNMEVVSVSKTQQKLSHAASAIFVITQEDIRRSGALNIPDLLRMAPGVDVAQINANNWAISVRGFNNRFSNKLLVLVDGRSVYTSSFGGVFWDVLDLPLEDIEQIEVIRGPGGSVWGANAVNGIINIITKKASETQGALVTTGGGNVQQGLGTVQYGSNLGSSTKYRAYTKYLNDGDFPDALGQNGGDGWHMLRGGFRTDTTLTSKDTLMIQGDLYSARESSPEVILPSITSPALVPIDFPFNLSGGFVQGVWQHAYSAQSNTSLEMSFDHYQRNDTLRDGRGTFDVNFQQQFRGWSRQNLVWDVEYRRVSSYAAGGLTLSFIPAGLTTNLFSAAVQDEITLIPNRLSLTAGARFEHNYYTGFNFMPSARVAWTPGERQTVWAAVSDAVRSPSQVDAGFRANLGSFTPPNSPLILTSFLGNPDFDDEALIAYELGYRAAVADWLSLDFSAYFNDYNHMESYGLGDLFFEPTPLPPHLVLPLGTGNLTNGEAHGLEASANWKVTGHWTLSPGYAFERIHMHLPATSDNPLSIDLAQRSSPVHSAQLRSHVNLVRRLTWDTSAYFADDLVNFQIVGGNLVGFRVPAYTRVDSQLTWQFGERGRFSIVGQNLVNDHHMEFVDWTQSAGTTLIKRSVYAELSWQF
jgi:iron complex outermembrane recepter protein